jgi:hypothetical protein
MLLASKNWQSAAVSGAVSGLPTHPEQWDCGRRYGTHSVACASLGPCKSQQSRPFSAGARSSILVLDPVPDWSQTDVCGRPIRQLVFGIILVLGALKHCDTTRAPREAADAYRARQEAEVSRKIDQIIEAKKRELQAATAALAAQRTRRGKRPVRGGPYPSARASA